MNYIDIAFVALAALCLLFGLIGRAGKKIWKLIVMVLAVVVAYIATGSLASTLLSTPLDFIPGGVSATEFLNQTIAKALEGSGFNLDLSTLQGFITGFVKLILFWVLALACMLVFGIVFNLIIGNIVKAIVKSAKRRKLRRKAEAQGKDPRRVRVKKNAFLTLGIPGALRACIFLVVLIFPLFVLKPLLTADAVGQFIPASYSQYYELAKTQISESKVFTAMDKVLEMGCKNEQGERGFQLAVLTYGPEGSENAYYLYDDVKSMPSLLNLAAKFIGGGEGGGSSNPIESIMSMSSEDLASTFAAIDESPVLKETITTVLEDTISSMLPEGTQIDLDLSNVSFAQEGQHVAAILDIVQNDEGQIDVENLTEEDMTNLVTEAISSDLVLAIASSGAIPEIEVGEDAKAGIEEMLQEQEIPQERIDALLKLFK